MPLLLHHDVGKHILIIDDLGSLETIDKWLESKPEISKATLAVVGTNLGNFLADLHLSTTQQNRAYLATQFKNDDMQRVIYTQVVQSVIEILNVYKVPDANQVYEVIDKEFQTVQQFHEKVFNLGDLWPGSILVSQNGTEIGVIDWEFAGLAHPSQDIGQFGYIPLEID